MKATLPTQEPEKNVPNSRGPLPSPTSRRSGGRALPAGLTAVAEPLPAAPPDHLGEAGALVWCEAAGCPWVQRSDAMAVRRLAELEDERRQLATVLATLGPVLSRPIVTPRGDIAGEEHYSNPVTTDLRRIDDRIAKLRGEIGLSPMTRARLGVRLVEGELGLDRLRARQGGDRPDPRLLHPVTEGSQ